MTSTIQNIKSITVFCGAGTGTEEIYRQEAYLLGKTLAESNVEVIYGGASIGLMGCVANGALAYGGKVTGVFPVFLNGLEIAHTGLTKLILVETMHERKLKMHQLSDAVIALPGGFGTLEELFEMLTWAQLGLHQNPIGILNVNGYFDELISFAEKMVERGFLKTASKDLLLVGNCIPDLLNKIQNYEAPLTEKVISTERT